MSDRPYTITAAAERLACSQVTVRALCRAGKLGSFRIGVGDKAYFRIPARALEEFERCGSCGSETDSTPTSEPEQDQSEPAWGPRIVRLPSDG
ncbi:MAG: helix-turn-helix domain-containing protein [Bradyrhizobium sp.]